MMVKCSETEAIYRWKTLCSHMALDKVLTGNQMAAIVKHVSSHYILLAKILFLHDRSDASFLLAHRPWLFFFLNPKESSCCLSARTINQISAGRRPTKRGACLCCNVIWFRWPWVSKWETCEVSAF